MRSASLAFVVVALATGCSRSAELPSSSTTAASAAPGSAPSAIGASSAAGFFAPSVGIPVSGAQKGTLALGERITAPLVPLTDIAKNPASFQGRVIATSGMVTTVCQEMGCWMQIQDASGNAHVRMHGHTFFVPKTASGHIARVQATIVDPAGNAKACQDGKSGGGASDCEEGKSAKVELDATGVELD